ncbi:MAG: hypothetical protein KDI30_00410, partial [Pseudomonadales bacterium]|nr:hypothetical protein [Pseudomonadales bacterium]
SGTYTFQDYQMLDYPYFPEIRGGALDSLKGFNAGVDRVVMAWASPVFVDKKTGIDSRVLLQSSEAAWLSRNRVLTPRVDDSGRSLFVPEGQQSSYPLAVELRGKFAGFQSQQPAMREGRLIVFASNEFVRDQTLQLLGAARNNVERGATTMLQNMLEFMVSDPELLALRSQSRFNRALPVMTQQEQQYWERLVYLGCFLGFLMMVLLIFVWHVVRIRRFRKMVAG